MQATPEHSQLDATEDEDSDDLDSAPAPPSQGVRAKGKVLESAEGSSDEDKIARTTSPPPRRELPFAKGNENVRKQETTNHAPVETGAAMDEDGDGVGAEEETSDDEL